MPSALERIPPHHEEAEVGVLGSILLESTRALDLCIEQRLEPASFYIPAHRTLFEAMLELSKVGRPIDVLTVAGELKRSGLLERVGGGAYLNSLVDRTPTAAHIEHYVQLVSDRHMLREIINRGRATEADCFAGALPAGELLAQAEQRLFELSDMGRSPQVAWQTVIHDTMGRIETSLKTGNGLDGLATGYGNLDKCLQGMRPTNLIILAARPSMGKTSLALNIAQNIVMGTNMPARATAPVGVFSLEMSRDEIGLRMLCTEAQISSHDVTGGYIGHTGPTHGKLVAAAAALQKVPLFLDDSAGLDITELRARARRMKAKHNVALIVIDYLQLLHCTAAKNQGRQVEISMVSAGLKAMAKELRLPVLCLSQLSRAPEIRGGDGRPRLSDLRESGSIEQDADVVLLLRRPCRYEGSRCDDRTLAVVDVAKHRNGPTRDDLNFTFTEEYTRFETRTETQN